MSDKNKKIMLDTFFDQLEEADDHALADKLDYLLTLFNPGEKLRNEKHLDILCSVMEDRPIDTEQKIQLIDFIKTSCKPYPRLTARVDWMALDRDEIMKVRWHALDVMKETSPENYEQFKTHPELANREVDPDKPALDINRERIHLAKKDIKNFKWWVIAPLAIFGSMAGLYFSRNTDLFVPLIIALSALIVLVLFISLLVRYRCPACGRFFARGKLILHSTQESAATLTSSQGHSQMMSKYTIKLYSTNCKYCKHEWIIRK